MGQLIFPNIPVEGWVICPDKHGLLDHPGDAICLPLHDGETIHNNGVSCGLAVLLNRGWGSEVFFSPSPKVFPDSPIDSSRQSV